MNTTTARDTTAARNTTENVTTLSRRSFVLGSGAVTVGFGFGATRLAGCATTPAGNASFTPVAWVTIGSDNVATIYSAGSEMGQGTMTALPMVLAEEMELDWNRVKGLFAHFSGIQHWPARGRACRSRTGFGFDS